jgi:hypothetical protein
MTSRPSRIAKTIAAKPPGNPERPPGRNSGLVVTPGVDLTLIDEMLRLSPEQRLRQNDRMAALAVDLQEAFAAGANGWPKHER